MDVDSASSSNGDDNIPEDSWEKPVPWHLPLHEIYEGFGDEWKTAKESTTKNIFFV